MIIRSLNEISNTERDIMWGNGRSRRYLLERDGMGYSLANTTVEPHTKSLLEYRNHLEACICLSGKGRVVNAETNESYDITPGTMYALDKHDKHYLIAEEEPLELLSIFSPALQGNEAHKLSDNENEASCY